MSLSILGLPFSRFVKATEIVTNSTTSLIDFSIWLVFEVMACDSGRTVRAASKTVGKFTWLALCCQLVPLTR